MARLLSAFGSLVFLAATLPASPAAARGLTVADLVKQVKPSNYNFSILDEGTPIAPDAVILRLMDALQKAR